MIIRPRPHWLRLLFVRRGSIVGRILTQQLFIFFLSCAVVLGHGQLFALKVTLNAAPFSLMGVAFAIFLGFRINASYDRYWEARKLWGAALVETRNLARLALTLPQGVEARPFVLGLIGFVTAMRNQLRRLPAETGLSGLLPDDHVHTLRPARFAPNLILLELGRQLRAWREAGRLESILAPAFEKSLNQLGAVLGGCERIASTPLPFTYTVILHRSAYIYCMLLPFGLVDSIGYVTPLVVCFISYTFFALEALSDEIEEPFGLAPNDLALDAMVSGIDATLREMLGETPPAAPQPDGEFVLR